MAKKTEGKLPFGEKNKRLQEIWKEIGSDKTLKVAGEAYKVKFGYEVTDQTISAAKYKAFPELQKQTRGVKAEGPTLENLQNLLVVMSGKGVKATELKAQLAAVVENPFKVFDEAAGSRDNLKVLLERVAAIQNLSA